MPMCPVHHRSELEDLEGPPALADPILREEYRTRRVELDEGRYQSKQRGQQNQTSNRTDDIQCALHDELPALEARRREFDERLTVAPHRRRMHTRDLYRARQ